METEHLNSASESEIQPLCKMNVVCWRSSPLSFCQLPQAMLNLFLLVSNFAVLPAVHFVLVKSESLYLRIFAQ